jgi:chromosome segregation ATPase
VKENDVAGMSTRELAKAIKERDAARREASDAQAALQRETSENKNRLQKVEDARIADRRSAEARERELEEALAKARQEAETARKEAQEAQEAQRKADEPTEIPKELMEKLTKEAEEAATEKQMAEQEKLRKRAEQLKLKEQEAQQTVKKLEQEAEELRKRLQMTNPAVAQFSLVFEQVQKDFGILMDLIGKMDEPTAVKLRTAVKAVLVKFDAQITG